MCDLTRTGPLVTRRRSNVFLTGSSWPSQLLAKVGSGRAALGEESREDWVNEGSENDLSATCLGKCHPQDQDELECVVEGYGQFSN